MGVKYTLPFRAHDDVAWRADISLDTWEGDVITITGQSEQAIVIAGNGDTDDPYSPIIRSNATLNFYDENHLIDIKEIQNAQDTDFVVRIYRGLDTSYNIFNSGASDVELGHSISQFTGNSIIASGFNATGYMPVEGDNSYQLNFFNQLAWYDTKKNFISGAFPSSNPIVAPNNAVYLRVTVTTGNWSSFSVLSKGKLFWKGYVIPDGVQSPMKSVPDISISCTDGLSLLAEMPFNYSDNLPGTTSTPNRCPMNFIRLILFDKNNLGLPLPIHWTNSLQCTAFNDEMFTESVKWGLLGEGWTSLQSPDPASPSIGYTYQKCEYILAGMLKSIQGRIEQMDGKWIIRRINDIVLGTFTDNSIAGDESIMNVVTVTKEANQVIGETGYRFINENQLTTVRKGVKTCKVTYQANVRENLLPNGNQDMLTPGGGAWALYWRIWDGDVNSTSFAVPGIDGRGGSASDLTNNGSGGPGNAFSLVDNSNVVAYLPIDSFTLLRRIQFGFVFSPVTGFPFDSSTGIIDYSSDPFKIRIIYIKDSAAYYLDEFAIWRDTITNISIKVDGTMINDIISVDFNKNNAILIPKPLADPIPGDDCKILVEFFINDGQRYTIDYIYFTSDENFDVYESTYSSTNTAIDERTLEISSSFGGYFLSNYMTNWDKSGDECHYTDGIYTGTLTGMTANAIMRFLYKSSVIYNGDMYVAGSDWSFDQIYTIDSLDGKYLPLSYSYNVETCIVSLTAIECRSDDIALTEKHYGSNDATLSN